MGMQNETKNVKVDFKYQSVLSYAPYNVYERTITVEMWEFLRDALCYPDKYTIRKIWESIEELVKVTESLKNCNYVTNTLTLAHNIVNKDG